MPEFNVNGMSADAFMRDVFEKSPFVFKKCLPDGFYGAADLNAALTHSMTSELPFTIGMHGRTVRQEDYASPMYNGIKQMKQLRIDPEKVERLLRAGANLKIQRFANVCPKVLDVVNGVVFWLGLVTSANGYFSFGQQRGLPVHWDSHDVLVVQLMGSKHWKIYQPTMALPLKAHRHQAGELPALRTPVLEVTLQAGEALYLPRGWWHDVTPVRGVKTLHIALGLHPPLVSDFLAWVLDNQTAQQVDFRKSIALTVQALDASALSGALSKALADPQLLQQFLAHYNAGKPPRAYFDVAADA
jgi:ribosomal protein L16 Arg81 hydroxylase